MNDLERPVRTSAPLAISEDEPGLERLLASGPDKADWLYCFPDVVMRNERTGELMRVKATDVEIVRHAGSTPRADFKDGDVLLRVAQVWF